MAEIILIVCAMSCCSSSVSGIGGFFGGFIPGTDPHFVKTTKLDKVKVHLASMPDGLEMTEDETFETWGSPGYCQDYKTYYELKEKYQNRGLTMRSSTTEYEKAYLTEDERERMYKSNPICRGYDDNLNSEGMWGEIRPK
jgi:hypothetical protein